MALPSKDDWPDLIAAITTLADAVDRLTFIVEEVAARGLDLPTRDEVTQDTP
jgi:hypothetical protein